MGKGQFLIEFTSLLQDNPPSITYCFPGSPGSIYETLVSAVCWSNVLVSRFKFYSLQINFYCTKCRLWEICFLKGCFQLMNELWISSFKNKKCKTREQKGKKWKLEHRQLHNWAAPSVAENNTRTAPICTLWWVVFSYYTRLHCCNTGCMFRCNSWGFFYFSRSKGVFPYLKRGFQDRSSVQIVKHLGGNLFYWAMKQKLTWLNCSCGSLRISVVSGIKSGMSLYWTLLQTIKKSAYLILLSVFILCTKFN